MIKVFSNFCYYFIAAVFVMLACAILAVGVTEGHMVAVCVAVLIFAASYLILRYISRTKCKPKRKSESTQILILLLCCLSIKMVLAFMYTAVPVADYKTFLSFADEASRQLRMTTNTLYMALAPHVFGYASLLGYIFFFFGTNQNLVVLMNVFCSTLSMLLVYHIGRQIGGQKMATSCAVLWIIFPSQGLWNMFVLSEPLYTALLLAFFDLVIYWNGGCFEIKKNILLAVTAGITLVVFNTCRPVGIIVLIAMIIVIFFVNMPCVSLNKSLWLAILLCVYFVGKAGYTQYAQFRIGYPLDSFSWYEVAVGFNEESQGTWNSEDFEYQLSQVNAYAGENSENPAEDVQEEFKEIALARIENTSGMLGLIYNKLSVLLGTDDTVVDHMMASEIHFAKNGYAILSTSCNLFYYVMVVGTAWGGMVLLKKKNKVGMVLIGLYSVGLTMGHMLVEVQGRYHYSILIGFMFLCGYGLSVETKTKTELLSQKIGTNEARVTMDNAGQ